MKNVINILAIAPYKGMAETLSSLAEDRDDINITIRTGNLQEGLEIARSCTIHNEYDVIISRGGTAELIQKNLDIPVIDAPLSVYDILRSMKMAENYTGKYAIAGFPSITSNALMLSDLLQLDIDIFTFQTQEDALPILQKLKDQSYSLVICDMIGSLTAEKIGLNSIFIPSGSESINAAINEAVKLVNASLYMYKQKEIFKTALLNDNESVMIFDPNGNLWFSTLANNSLDHQLLNMIQTYLPAFMKTSNQIFERQLHDVTYQIMNQSIYYDGETYTLLRISKKHAIFEDTDKTVSIYNDYDETSSDRVLHSNSANFVGDIHTLIEKYAPTTFPVLVTGETGTGKEKAAAQLYKYGPYHNKPYYIIDCSLLTERKWNALLENDNSPFHNVNTTIHIKNVGALSNTELSKLYTYIEDTNLLKRNRIIFTLITPDSTAEHIKNYLINHLSCLLLPIEPLRKRMDDISSIAMLYINQMNSQLGKQIVGFEADAFELIKNFPWPNNLDQFRRVLKEAIIITTTSYITTDTIKMLLSQEDLIDTFTHPYENSSQIDCTQTLDKITYDIIKSVLAEEHMNKEKTAKRLGISRSTLWRTLKNFESADK